MNKEYDHLEIKWNTKTEYVDIDTGEIISKERAIQAYVIVNKKKKSNVYKTTGTTTITNECRTSQQLKLFS